MKSEKRKVKSEEWKKAKAEAKAKHDGSTMLTNRKKRYTHDSRLKTHELISHNSQLILRLRSVQATFTTHTLTTLTTSTLTIHYSQLTDFKS